MKPLKAIALSAPFPPVSFAKPSQSRYPRSALIPERAKELTAEVAEEYAREKPMRVRIPVQYDGQEPR